ncbi:hypothetical protein L1987_56133 [Smallanthus sonchifolius]|uniref:Uncharacterized protein n=1 Tax=Smallanthus sonchifolius TaxID=185202 RepID=A0ACB9ECM7_9ASTR|nr:hypothetical protein L1987_56133 [Smallanthus sonchifolius]
MCRGFQPIDQTQRLFKIKSFHLILSFSNPPKSLPDSLTLHYLPRITGGPLEVNGSVIKPDVPVFVTLYRVVTGECRLGEGKQVVYGSRERVRVSEGVRFEVYVKEEKVVKGGFRKGGGGEWRMECRCGLEGDGVVKEVEVVVAAEDGETAVMKEKVEMVVRRRKRRCFEGLEEIPEQESEEEDVEVECCCCECKCGGDVAEEEGGCEVEVEVEGVRWAVDVGIWVVCLGVGYLVSKASSKSMRRRRRRLL